VTSAPEFTRRELQQIVKSTDQLLPPPCVLAYRLYPNGKQELVRGAQLKEVPIRAWKDVLGVGRDTMTYNFLAPPEIQLLLKIQGGTEDGFVPSNGVESAIVTPDLLLKEIDVVGSTPNEHPSPVLPRPGK
jgi:hypothetical protein